MKRFTSILLVSALLAVFTGCATEGGGSGTSLTTGSGQETTTADLTTSKITPDLPDVKYDGYEMKFFVRGPENSAMFQVLRNIDTEEENGEPLNDALYTRNARIEEKYDVKITGIGSNGTNGAGAAMATMLLAGDSTYDVIIPAMSQIGAVIMSDVLVDLKTVPHIGWDKPWWDQSLDRDISIGGKTFATMGDICISTSRAILMMMFNKQMIADFTLENPYDLVRNDKWTLDKLNEMSRNVSKDLNGDGVLNAEDQYGYLVQQATSVNLFYGTGENVTKKDKNDIPELALVNNKRSVDVLTKMIDIFSSSDYVFWGDDNNTRDMFVNGQGLFFGQALNMVEVIRNEDVNFGVIPVPKFDANQKEFYHFADTHCMSVLAIPKTNENLDRTGVILEALCAESSDTIVPAFYDINLIGKFFRDEESAEMLDIILGTRVVSLDEMYTWGAHKMVRGILDGRNYNIASTVEANADVIKGKIDEAIKTIVK